MNPKLTMFPYKLSCTDGGNANWCSQCGATRKFLKKTKTELPYDPAGFPGGSGGENLPANAGDVRDGGSVPGLERAPGGGHGNPLQYFCLENSMDREAWQDKVCRVPKSGTLLKWLSMHK